MNIEIIKKELIDMKAVVFEMSKEINTHSFNPSFAIGYLKAILDLERFISQIEYLEKIKETHNGNQG